MKFQLMSDLHVEFGWDCKFTTHPGVTLILAGDIHSNTEALILLIKDACDNYENVIMVAGNHEFYGNNYDEVIHTLRAEDRNISNFFFLEKGIAHIEDVTFLGGTLWSNPDWDVFRNINDAYKIEYRGHKLLDTDIAHFNEITTKFIKKELKRKRKNKLVVVTHFGPDPALMHKRWLSYPRMNTYFWATGFQEHFHLADMWLYGHTHDSGDMVLDGCRCICNPHGYKMRGDWENAFGFNPELIIEV